MLVAEKSSSSPFLNPFKTSKHVFAKNDAKFVILSTRENYLFSDTAASGNFALKDRIGVFTKIDRRRG